jgi:putative ABC transport system permease protein
MAQALAADFPEVEEAVSLSPLWAAGLTKEVFSIRNLEKDLKFDESNVLAVDTTFFDVFPFPILRGEAKKALKNVNGILLSETMAKKYFGDADPIGKQLAVNSDTIILEVMAVFKDVPEQSHFHFDFLVSYVREKSFDPEDEYYTWADFGHFNYVRLKDGADPKQLESKLLEWSRKYIEFSNDQFNWYKENNYGFKLQAVRDIHLHSNLRWELEPNGNIEYVYIMAAAALLTLIIASINFMNLMTAKSTERAKEIGIRKTLGAMRLQLSVQFFSEAILLSLLSIAVSILLVEASLPLYNSVTGLHFKLNYSTDLLALIALGIIIGAASGIYPALFLSKFTTQSILKGKFNNSQRGLGLRNGLIVFQFAISMALISGAAIIFNQLDYIRHKNIGFNKEEVVVLPIKNGQVSSRIEALKSELTRIDGVLAVSAASNLPGGQYNQNTVFTFDNPTEGLDVSESFVDKDFLKTMNIELTDGRTFTPQDFEHKEHVFMINETAAQQLGLDEPVGE